jgi:hypothetical protein
MIIAIKLSDIKIKAHLPKIDKALTFYDFERYALLIPLSDMMIISELLYWNMENKKVKIAPR